MSIMFKTGCGLPGFNFGNSLIHSIIFILSVDAQSFV